MKYLDLKKDGDVFIVTMTNGAQANTFTDEVLKEHMAVCDEIEKSTENGAVILTSNDQKFWTNGINLEWIMTKGGDYFSEFKEIIDAMLLRWATLRFPTIAAINGHAFGGGAILACCFDFRFMREDRGFFCFPEIDVNIPFTDQMHEVIGWLPNRQALWELAFTGRKIGGAEAKKMQVVNDCFPEADLMPKAMELAKLLASKNRATYCAIKQGLKRNLMK